MISWQVSYDRLFLTFFRANINKLFFLWRLSPKVPRTWRHPGKLYFFVYIAPTKEKNSYVNDWEKLLLYHIARHPKFPMGMMHGIPHVGTCTTKKKIVFSLDIDERHLCPYCGDFHLRVRETFELNQLKSTPSTLLPVFSGFHRLPTCCH